MKRILLVDPSRFTPAYDAALGAGLEANGAQITWVLRPLRDGESDDLGRDVRFFAFYPRALENTSLPTALRSPLKGLFHVMGLIRLIALTYLQRFDAVHIQWAVLPLFDGLAMAVIKLRTPVILTVHDARPFNGDSGWFFQKAAYGFPLKVAHHLIAHTKSARAALLERGVDPGKISIIPHGPLSLSASPTRLKPDSERQLPVFVLFGMLKPYKGLDTLVSAVAGIRDQIKGRARIVVAGEPKMDLDSVLEQVQAHGLGDLIEFRLGRLPDQGMADLFEEADCLLFPYRQIDASGVYFLIKSLRKWIIASDVGIFSEELRDSGDGALVEPGNPDALAKAMLEYVDNRPTPSSSVADCTWEKIGFDTIALYESRKSKFSA